MIQSVEPNIADLANGWLKTYKLNYNNQIFFFLKKNERQGKAKETK